MGVHRVTSEAAKAYVRRERVLGTAISVLGKASTSLGELDKKTLEECGDLAYDLLPHSPGHAGKLMLVIARLFWALAGVEEKERGAASLEEIEKRLEALEKTIG